MSQIPDKVLLFAVVVVVLMVSVVWCDYPPPSEDKQGYYSKKNQTRKVIEEAGYQSDWDNSDWSSPGNPNPGKCVDIPNELTLCRDIGYQQMRLPNLLEHDTLREVSEQASSWVRLLQVRCHPDTQVFLCSLFAPVCLSQPIWPCRSLCLAVKAGCEDRMLKYGFPWPEMLRCDQYPLDDELCISDKGQGGQSSCSACLADTFESTVDHYCRATFAMRIKVRQAIVIGSDMKIDADKKKKIYKTGSLKSSELDNASLYIVNGSTCDCPALDGIRIGGSSKNKVSFIVMGNMVNGRLVISNVHRVDNRSKEVNRAMKAVRKPDVCTQTSSSLGAKRGSAGGLSPPNAKKGTKPRKGQRKSKESPNKSGRKTTEPPSEWKRTTLKRKATTTTSAPTTTIKRTQHSDRQRRKEQKQRSSASVTPLFY